MEKNEIVSDNLLENKKKENIDKGCKAETGVLYLVATPIGNLEDITFRAVRILKEADLIAAEDTRNSLKLLNHFEINTPMTSYHEFNKYDKADVLIEKLLEGKNIAVITDAGTPGISDPGEVLVQKCYEAGVVCIPVPGAVAAVNALIASGMPTRRFTFEAFLPQDKESRRRIIEELKNETRTIIIYEAPHRLIRTLEELEKIFGGERELTIAKELTKKHEHFKKTNFKEALQFYNEVAPRGEYVLVIHGKPYEEIREEQKAEYETISIEDHIKQLMEDGLTKKDAVKKVAELRGLPKREVYLHGIDI